MKMDIVLPLSNLVRALPKKTTTVGGQSTAEQSIADTTNGMESTTRRVASQKDL